MVLDTSREIEEDRTWSGQSDGMLLSRRQTRDDQSHLASRDTLFRVIARWFRSAWRLVWLVITGACRSGDCLGDPMGVQGVLGELGLEHGLTRR